jgi:CheY-like chemotaxis protein
MAQRFNSLPDSPSSGSQPLDRRTPVSTNSLSILVVDDDPVALEVARERLERLGLEVSTRSQALGTSQWILENRPDFTLLDVMMPALTGPELARVVRKHLSTSIILYSSRPQAELNELVRELDVSGAISKTLGDQEFAREITRIIRQTRNQAGRQ